MTTVAAASAATTTTTSSAATKDLAKSTLDYDSFLKLLVAQMQNQDPLNPTDPTEQLSQLASFSNVEQTIKLNQKLESMVSISALNQGAAVIGKTVMSADGKTSGVVSSVTVIDGVAYAALTDGSQVTLGNGVVISETKS